MAPACRAVFHLVLIKPTHYDDDGYPIQWMKGVIPSNTLACLNALARDASRRKILGPDVEIRVHAYDETTQRIRADRIIRDIRCTGGTALIGLVGVQTNQFPRAVDIARPFIAAKLPVCMGGFHVSGCVAMLPEMPPEMLEAQQLGISFFVGEAEDGRLDRVIRDAWNGSLQPVYNFLDALPSLTGEPAPILPPGHTRRISGSLASLDLSRGCPYQCSFCTIINVQGRKSRVRSADDIEQIIRENYAHGIRRYFLTDDNLARNSEWEALFDRMIRLREEGLRIGFSIQVDALCHRIPNFIEKAGKAGVGRVFIGLENINPETLIATKKHQNKITEYRLMLQRWRDQGVITCAGYILGFPADTKESILRDVEIIKRELPLDVLEFFFLTPLPGSEDHKVQRARQVWMDADLNKYDLFHRVSHHPTMSDPDWEDAYRSAWHSYYTPDHMRTVLRRVAANPVGNPKKMLNTLLWFKLMIAHEDVHPLEGGTFRRKSRRDRRRGMARQNSLLFCTLYGYETLRKAWRYWWTYRALKAIYREVIGAPDRWAYSDLSLTAPQESEFDTLGLYRSTVGGNAAVARMRRDDELRSRLAAGASATLPAS